MPKTVDTSDDNKALTLRGLELNVHTNAYTPDLNVWVRTAILKEQYLSLGKVVAAHNVDKYHTGEGLD